MKKIIFLSFIVALFASCGSNTLNNNNPYIPNYAFTVSINTDFATYNSLKFASNAIYYSGAGVKGIIVFNTGSGYNAFDAACPNQTISPCSTMTINGINAVCGCNKEEYNLFTGLSTLKYPLKQYRVEVNGSIIRVYN